MSSLLIDAIMIFLLGGVILYTIRLQSKLESLQSVHQELSPILKNLPGTLLQTSASVGKIRQLSVEINESLGHKIPLASSLRDELSFMLEQGDKLAQRIEALYHDAHQQIETVSTVPFKKSDASLSLKAEDSILQKSEASESLLSSLRSMR
jgi:hypothetical protein